MVATASTPPLLLATTRSHIADSSDARESCTAAGVAGVIASYAGGRPSPRLPVPAALGGLPAAISACGEGVLLLGFSRERRTTAFSYSRWLLCVRSLSIKKRGSIGWCVTAASPSARSRPRPACRAKPCESTRRRQAATGNPAGANVRLAGRSTRLAALALSAPPTAAGNYVIRSRQPLRCRVVVDGLQLIIRQPDVEHVPAFFLGRLAG